MNTKQRFDKAVSLLTEYIMLATRDIQFVCKERTTNNHEEFMKVGITFEISLEGCENTVYGNEYINILSRVWHDNIHYKYDLSFDYQNEIAVSAIQEMDFMLWSILNGKDKQATMDAMQLIHEEVVSQYEYYMKHNKFVKNQYKFVYDRFKGKIENE